jgi:hypothetical protein
MPMVLHATVSLQAAINQYERNAEARPFVWTASAVSIVAKLTRSPVASEWISALLSQIGPQCLVQSNT